MRRVVVLGPGGSGKSTLARRLGQLTGLPVIHLDRVYWRPGWVPTPESEWEAVHRDLTAGEAWIIDGNYGSTVEVRLARADTVVFLDVPRIVALIGVLRRRLMYRRRKRPDMAPGCPEKVDWEFLGWVWNYARRDREPLLAQLADAERRGVTVHRLRTRRQMRLFLKALEVDGGQSAGAEPSAATPRRRARIPNAPP